MVLRIINSGVMPPEEIMLKDTRLLEELRNDPCPVLHFYEWQGDCFTYGHFSNPEDYLDLAALQSYGIKSAKRPTGGGIIFHLTDLAFSVFIPLGHRGFSLNSLDNYAFINRLVAQAISALTSHSLQTDLWVNESCVKECRPNFCMAKPTQFDLVANGKKVGGAAQRRKKWGFLHQGSISLSLPSTDLLRAVIKDEAFFQAILKNHCPLIEHMRNFSCLKIARDELKNVLAKIFLAEI